MPSFLDKYKVALQGLVDEETPKFAAVGVNLEYFDKCGQYTYTFVSPTKSQYGNQHFPNVFGFTLEKGSGAAAPVAALVERFDRRGTEPFELFRSEFGQNSAIIQEIMLEFIRNSDIFKIF